MLEKHFFKIYLAQQAIATEQRSDQTFEVYYKALILKNSRIKDLASQSSSLI